MIECDEGGGFRQPGGAVLTAAVKYHPRVWKRLFVFLCLCAAVAASARAPVSPAGAEGPPQGPTRAGRTLSDVDRAKLRKYAAAYRGPDRPLVDEYLASMQAP